MSKSVNGTTYVYIIKNDKNKYKIGRSKNPSKRLKQLQTGNNSKLYLIATALGDIHLEKRLHKMFFYSREVGEWFNLSEDTLKALIEYLSDRYETIIYQTIIL
jgi:hypothetical protein